MRKERLACLEVFVLLVAVGILSSPGLANSSTSLNSVPCSFSGSENYCTGFVDSVLKSSGLELGRFTPASFVEDLLLAGGGGSVYTGGSKGSGKVGYQGSKGSGGYQGPKGSGGYKDSQGKTESKGSKGTQNELKVEKEKNENSLPVKEVTPQEVNF